MKRDEIRQWRRQQRHDRHAASRLARARAVGLVDYDKTDLDVEYEAVMSDCTDRIQE